MHQEAFSGPGTPGNSASNVENSIFLQHSKPPAGKPKGDCLNYKPIPLKWPALAFLFLVICSLLALLEYIHHLLPITKESGGVPQASMLVPSMSLATLMTSMSTASHHARMAAMETPAINIHRDVQPSKKPPVSFPALNPRHYAITNDTAVTNNTIIQTMNGTNLATNISRPQISLTSQDRCNHTSDGLTHRSCLYPNPGSYASVNGGPMFHITSTCAWEPDPPDGVPFFMTPTHGLCGRNLWISNDTLDCPIRAYSFSCETLYEDSFDDSHLECNEIPYSPNSPVTMFQVDLTLDHSRCVNTMNRCSCDPGEPLHSSNSQPPVTQIFSILGETTVTTRSADFESTVTSIFTGKDGSPTTLLEPTTVHNGISTFTTSGPVAINIITATMNEGGQLWASISKTSMDSSLSQSAAVVSDALPTGITNHPITLTQLNQLGVPTATATDYLETLLDSNGLPTATIIVTLETLTNQSGVPTKTIAEFLPTGTSNSTNSGPTESTNSTSELTSYFGVNSSRYVIGAFVPILMSTILSMLIQLVDKNIKLMVPFYSLTRAGGATAADSLCMAPGGLVHLPRSVRFFY
ncbi:hypothetical protein L207DRAFT_624196 [Hyaloscypha variabilis F]|uniref:Uncharacterized protein n=1 Tax=Hyaloscypha variabilis (strain UAMH 11265 / GT02V1 / F) TaxID=1149755 RepID=A0A2J6RTK1_HYAVF|nr:hypothetical protein L207DRAFT_624196 [Hyaloscypha variabilis F]